MRAMPQCLAGVMTVSGALATQLIVLLLLICPASSPPLDPLAPKYDTRCRTNIIMNWFKKEGLTSPCTSHCCLGHFNTWSGNTHNCSAAQVTITAAQVTLSGSNNTHSGLRTHNCSVNITAAHNTCSGRMFAKFLKLLSWVGLWRAPMVVLNDNAPAINLTTTPTQMVDMTARFMDVLVDNFVSEDRQKVSYLALEQSTFYKRNFDEFGSLLKKVDPLQMNDTERSPQSTLSVTDFWQRYYYKVGRYTLHLDDMEHGILSCPPLTWYDSSHLDQELDDALRGFCNKGVKAVSDSTLLINSIFDWFRVTLLSPRPSLSGGWRTVLTIRHQ
ncbi:putative gamma-interferon-inducible lysosomal thiol reductase-like 3 [Homarus americanus]|uniref:Putative gamma-interferon-inducible lysosomal thiol reductase-like 3 n=1 Tax=Homarus americanus TaxID=6706 RepID=A0A8J5JI33_HOMAM|nr:putative gamma-interferon-inducible lysosomal thiol reductase-like 3 [Homarus americanus]